MKSRTCRYSIIIGQNAHLMKRLISLLLLFCIGLPLLAQQQRPTQTPKRDQKKKEVAEIDTIPLYNGTYIGVDLYGIGSKLLGGDFMSSEVSVAVNLKNKFIPTFEFGMGGTDTWNPVPFLYVLCQNKPLPDYLKEFLPCVHYRIYEYQSDWV